MKTPARDVRALVEELLRRVDRLERIDLGNGAQIHGVNLTGGLFDAGEASNDGLTALVDLWRERHQNGAPDPPIETRAGGAR